MTAPYDVRKIDVNLTFGGGNFGDTGTTSNVNVSGLRVTALIENAALPNTGNAAIRIYGLTLDQMNQFSRAGLAWRDRLDRVKLTAGDSTGMSVVFNGIIVEAAPEFDGPNSSLAIVASSANDLQYKPVAPTSFPASSSVGTALGQIVQKGGLTLENNGGVSAVLASPYYPGTVWAQLNKCVFAADCLGVLDTINNVLAIWPKNGNRGGGVISEISPATGMIGYPSFQQTTVIVRTVFDPTLVMGNGKQVRVMSQLTAANGVLTIVTVNHNLSSQLPGGPWETIVTATKGL